jgi:Mrp family chromosome partitioning ATPase
VGTRPPASLIAALQPSSAAAGHYRSLGRRTEETGSGTPRRVIVVTSPGTGEGKTVTVGNLAVMMARESQRSVLLVDTDLRHPGLHTVLGIAREPGLVDVLTGSSRLDQALVSLPELGLSVLPAGKAHDRPGELLGSVPMREMIGDLRRRFERLFLDSAAADIGVIQPLADGVLLVVRSGQTTTLAVDRALSALPAAKLVGLVLNDTRTVGRASRAWLG